MRPSILSTRRNFSAVFCTSKRQDGLVQEVPLQANTWASSPEEFHLRRCLILLIPILCPTCLRRCRPMLVLVECLRCHLHVRPIETQTVGAEMEKTPDRSPTMITTITIIRMLIRLRHRISEVEGEGEGVDTAMHHIRRHLHHRRQCTNAPRIPTSRENDAIPEEVALLQIGAEVTVESRGNR